eukprot:TRINITY_DN47895_c0_g1_i1.p2 TRINITY_DN47895_c0_g1~~TRINITY_DN47895_c0_g1_i1.p2  ORF type:complete len:336 (+),score=18.18 TRINITY_DN47895_c0_g1_i1:163-1170(+)
MSSYSTSEEELSQRTDSQAQSGTDSCLPLHLATFYALLNALHNDRSAEGYKAAKLNWRSTHSLLCDLRLLVDPAHNTTEEEDPTGSVVHLDVGGTVVHTFRSTLVSVEDSVLFGAFSGLFNEETQDDGSVFLDRDGTIFSTWILAWLRDSTTAEEWIQSASYDTKCDILREANWYSLDDLCKLFQHQHHTVHFLSAWEDSLQVHGRYRDGYHSIYNAPYPDDPYTKDYAAGVDMTSRVYAGQSCSILFQATNDRRTLGSVHIGFVPETEIVATYSDDPSGGGGECPVGSQRLCGFAAMSVMGTRSMYMYLHGQPALVSTCVDRMAPPLCMQQRMV